MFLGLAEARGVAAALVIALTVMAAPGGAGEAVAEEVFDIPPTTDAQPDPAKASSQSVVLVGSSSINQFFGHIIANDLAKLGLHVTRRGFSAAGLSRPDFRDVSAEVAQLPLDRHTRSVLLYFGANDAQALWLRPDERSDPNDVWVPWDDERWSPTYYRRARSLVEGLCERGVARVIVLSPADVVSDTLQRRLDRIRDLQRSAASVSRCGHFIATRDEESDPGELRANLAALHASDGVHMNRLGAQQTWRRIRERVLHLLM